MSHKKSGYITERNKNIWTMNLVQIEESHRKVGPVPLEKQSLDNKSRIPFKIQIVGRCLHLGASIKRGIDCVKVIMKDHERSNKFMAKDIIFSNVIKPR